MLYTIGDREQCGLKLDLKVACEGAEQRLFLNSIKMSLKNVISTETDRVWPYSHSCSVIVCFSFV